MRRGLLCTLLIVLTALWPGRGVCADPRPRHRHGERVRDLLVGARGKYVYSLSFDGTIARIPKSMAGEVLERETGGLLCAGCLVKGGDLLVGGELRPAGASPVEYFVERLGADLLLKKRIEVRSRATVTSLHCIAHPRYAATSAANELLVFDIESGEELARTSIFGGFMGQARTSPKGTYIAVTSQAEHEGRSTEPCRLSVFDNEGGLLGTWDFPSQSEYKGAQVQFSDDKTLLLVAQRSVRSFRLPPGKSFAPCRVLEVALPGRPTASAPARRRDTLLLAIAGAIHRLNYRSGRHEQLHMVSPGGQRSAYHTDAINVLAQDPDSSRVYFGGGNGVVYEVRCD